MGVWENKYQVPRSLLGTGASTNLGSTGSSFFLVVSLRNLFFFFVSIWAAARQTNAFFWWPRLVLAQSQELDKMRRREQ
jgi:hypothetical protein